MRWAVSGGRMVVCALICVALSAAAADAKAPLRWSKIAHVGHNGISALSCPSTTLCVAGSADGLLVSTNPAGDAGTWKLVFVPPAGANQAPQVVSVSCPTVSFCAAVTAHGDLLTSTNPGGGPVEWKLTALHIPIGRYPHSFQPAVSCASASLCVAISTGSRTVLSSTNPAGGTGDWKSVRLSHPLQTVACTRPHLCVLGDDHGDVRTSTNPTGTARAWTFAHIVGRPGSVDDLHAAACGSQRWCLIGAVAIPVDVLILATKPTVTTPMTPGAWQDQVAVTFGDALFSSGSCVGSFCAYASSDGWVYYPGRFMRDYRKQTRTRVDRPPNRMQGGNTVSCVSRRWCALGALDGNFYIGKG